MEDFNFYDGFICPDCERPGEGCICASNDQYDKLKEENALLIESLSKIVDAQYNTNKTLIHLNNRVSEAKELLNNLKK